MLIRKIFLYLLLVFALQGCEDIVRNNVADPWKSKYGEFQLKISHYVASVGEVDIFYMNATYFHLQNYKSDIESPYRIGIVNKRISPQESVTIKRTLGIIGSIKSAKKKIVSNEAHGPSWMVEYQARKIPKKVVILKSLCHSELNSIVKVINKYSPKEFRISC